MTFWRRRGLTLEHANVQAGWKDDDGWHAHWEPPRNVVAGEASYRKALLHAAGLKEPGNGVIRPVDVVLRRERRNRHDSNAFAAYVDGLHVGYLRKAYAAAIAKPCDQVGCESFTLCGVLRGGYEDAPDIGCHLWVGRRISSAPRITLADDDWIVQWPPGADELLRAARANRDKAPPRRRPRRG